MTDPDDDLATRLRNTPWVCDDRLHGAAADRIEDLAAQLAAARTVTYRLFHGWEPLDGQWRNESEVDIDGTAVRIPMSASEAAWLADFDPEVSPVTDPDDPSVFDALDPADVARARAIAEPTGLTQSFVIRGVPGLADFDPEVSR